MLVNEIFKSIQGEGSYAGTPVTFVRLSGCTRNCSFCDTKYHTNGKKLTSRQVMNKILKLKCETVVWTGGEPALQREEIEEVIKLLAQRELDNRMPNINHHLETNGDLMMNYKLFQYVCCSPKALPAAKNFTEVINMFDEGGDEFDADIKVVTDMTMNKELLPYATMVMPLTTYSEDRDKKIEQDVWDYCVNNNVNFCLRQHVHVWGTKRGI